MSAWIQHIKEFAKEKGLSFGCALSDPDCSKTYRMKKEMKKNPITIAEPTGNPKLQMKGIEIKRPMSKDVTEIKPKKTKKKEINEMMVEWSEGYTPPVKEKKSKPKKKVELVIEEEPPKPVEPIKAKRVAKKAPLEGKALEQALFLAHTAFEDWTSDTIEDFYNPDMSLKISERKYDKYVSEAIDEIGKKYNLPKGWVDMPKPKI